jgi:hypothetical protein
MFRETRRVFRTVSEVQGIADEQKELFGINTTVVRYYLPLGGRLVFESRHRPSYSASRVGT